MKSSKSIICILSVAIVALIVFVANLDPQVESESIGSDRVAVDNHPIETVKLFDKEIKDEVETKYEIKEQEEREEDLSLLPSLDTKCYTSQRSGGNKKTHCRELIKIIHHDNGDLWKEIWRHSDGTIRTKIINYIDGYDNGWNIKVYEHEYWDYELETLKIMAEQNDRDAQLILANKLFLGSSKAIDRKQARKYALMAAKNGHTNAILILANSYKEEDKAKQRAYLIISSKHSPKYLAQFNEVRIGHRAWTNEQIAKSEELMNELEKEIFKQ